MKKYILLFSIFSLVLLTISLSSCRKSDYETESEPQIINDFGEGTGTTTWTADNEYIVEGFVFVNDGQELTIEPGAVIRFRTGQGSAASALIVARGGKINAAGTAEKPIIFTVEGDDLEGSVPIEAKGLWGGLIILGRAPINISGGEAHIEGIPVYEQRGIYGGFDDKDNSGVLSYVSIRHCGTNIGEGNEINGLTLGAVGSETQIDHIEVVSSADDGVEIFGGSVNIRYLAVALCGDDIVDCDLGYSGYGQFWFGMQESSQGDKLLEIGGGIDPVLAQPYTMPQFFNLTMIGRGQPDGPQSMLFNRNAGGTVSNSIFLEQGRGIYVEYLAGSQNSFEQMQEGRLQFNSNIFFNINGNTVEGICNIATSPGQNVDDQDTWFENYFSAAFNEVSDPGIVTGPGTINPFPQGNIYDNLASVPDEWFETTTFKGAFYTFNWMSGWTLISAEGLVP